jgi:hypothetical protein
MSRWFATAGLFVCCWTAALGQTNCPTVSDNVSILSVNIVGAPMPVGFAGLDLKTHYLTVSFFNQTSRMFIGVPRGLVQGFQTQWSSLAQFPQAIMQEKSTCPLLTENNIPIWNTP